jgi:hypothetical protein
MGTGSRRVAEPELTDDCGEVDGMTKIRFYSESTLVVRRLKRWVVARATDWRLFTSNRRSRDCECNGDLSTGI